MAKKNSPGPCNANTPQKTRCFGIHRVFTIKEIQVQCHILPFTPLQPHNVGPSLGGWEACGARNCHHGRSVENQVEDSQELQSWSLESSSSSSSSSSQHNLFLIMVKIWTTLHMEEVWSTPSTYILNIPSWNSSAQHYPIAAIAIFTIASTKGTWPTRAAVQSQWKHHSPIVAAVPSLVPRRKLCKANLPTSNFFFPSAVGK